MTILVLSRFGPRLEPLVRAGLPAVAGPGAAAPGTPLQLAVATSFRDLPPSLEDVEIVLTFHLPDGFARRAPRLRWVQSTGAGVDRILASGLPEQVRVSRMVGSFGRPLSEYALSAALAHTQRHAVAAAQQAAHSWQGYEPASLAGSRVGILGAGEIGREIGAVFAACGARVSGLRRRGGAAEAPFESMYAADDLHAFLRGLDFLIVVAPLTPDTRGMLDAAALAQLPPHAYLINIARGELLDDEALLDALRGGRLAGAALDVFATEPLPAEHPYWTAPGVRVTPHVAGISEVPDMAAQFLANLQRYMDGAPLAHQVDRGRGY